MPPLLMWRFLPRLLHRDFVIPMRNLVVFAKMENEK